MAKCFVRGTDVTKFDRRRRDAASGISMSAVRTSGLMLVCGLVILSCFAVASVGHAGDYAIAYGFDFSGERRTRVVDSCDFGRDCMIELGVQDLVLAVRVTATRGRTGAFSYWANVRVRGPSSCCLLGGGDRSKEIPLTKGAAQLDLFRGRSRRGNEWVRNEQIGSIWIAVAPPN
jgi:hypothetical protein